MGGSVAKEKELDHYTHLITAEEFWNALSGVQYFMDQPLADPACIALYFVSKLASRAGQGGAVRRGERTSCSAATAFIICRIPNSRYQKIVPAFLRRAVGAVMAHMPDFRGRDFLVRASRPLEDVFIGNASMYNLKEKKKLLKRPGAGYESRPDLPARIRPVKDYDDVTKMQYLDINLWMVGDILLKADRMSMANSLELRVPFLDREVFPGGFYDSAQAAGDRRHDQIRHAEGGGASSAEGYGRRSPSWDSRCPSACGSGRKSITRS